MDGQDGGDVCSWELVLGCGLSWIGCPLRDCCARPLSLGRRGTIVRPSATFTRPSPPGHPPLAALAPPYAGAKGACWGVPPPWPAAIEGEGICCRCLVPPGHTPACLLRWMDGVSAMWGSAGCAPLRPGHPPLAALAPPYAGAKGACWGATLTLARSHRGRGGFVFVYVMAVRWSECQRFHSVHLPLWFWLMMVYAQLGILGRLR